MTSFKDRHLRMAGGEIHPSINLYYPTELDMQAGINEINGHSLSTVNLYCQAFARDTKNTWLLLQVEPTIKWELVAGTLVTRQDEVWHVDSVNGNDITGDGSQVNPFRTLHCLDNLPKLRHDLKIRFAASAVYDYFPRLTIDTNHWAALSDRVDGRLILDASGLDPIVVSAGPYTVDSVSGVGDVPLWFTQPLATDLVVAPNPSWTVHQWWGKHIQLIGGFWDGYTLPIFKNSNNTIRTYPNTFSLAPGQQFRIVEEPVVIDVTEPIYIYGNQTYKYPPSVFISGVKFRVNPSTFVSQSAVNINDTNLFLSFCSISTPASDGKTSLVNSSINASAPILTPAFDKSIFNTGFEFPSLIFTALNEALPTSLKREVEMNKNSLLRSSCLRGQIAMIESYNSSTTYSLCGGVYISNTDISVVEGVFIEQLGFSDRAIELHDGYTYLNSGYIVNASLALNMVNRGSGRIHWLQGGPVDMDYGTDMRAFSKIRMLSTLTIKGQLYAFRFDRTLATFIDWPADGTTETDGQGSYVLNDTG